MNIKVNGKKSIKEMIKIEVKVIINLKKMIKKVKNIKEIDRDLTLKDQVDHIVEENINIKANIKDLVLEVGKKIKKEKIIKKEVEADLIIKRKINKYIY